MIEKNWRDNDKWKDEFVEVIYMCADDTGKCITEEGNKRVFRITAQAFKKGVPKFNSCPSCGSPVTLTKKKGKK